MHEWYIRTACRAALLREIKPGHALALCPIPRVRKFRSAGKIDQEFHRRTVEQARSHLFDDTIKAARQKLVLYKDSAGLDQKRKKFQ